jgi:Cu/Ag efflux protein CusF
MLEAAMKSSRAIILGLAAAAMFSLGALAQEARQGTISRIDPSKGTIAVAETGTTGSSAMSGAQEYKLQDPLLFNAIKDGDRILFTMEDKEGVKTITKLQKQ